MTSRARIGRPSPDSPNPPVALKATRLRFLRLLAGRARKSVNVTIGGGIVLFIMVSSAFASIISPHDPREINLSNTFASVSGTHPLGTDDLGRDVLSRILHGGNVSLTVSLIAVLSAMLLGGGIGSLAGFFGGRVDQAMMRIMDVLMAFPGVLLALAVVAVLGPGIRNVVVAVAVFSIPSFARLSRSSTLTIREQDYILAARAIGVSSRRILGEHVIPNVLPPLIVLASLRIATAILTVSGLSFLGLGVRPPTPEWGAMLAGARNYMTSSPMQMIYPGLAIMFAVLGFNLLGDGLRDVLDPRSAQ